MSDWRKNLRKVEPYIPGEQPQVKDIIKLNTNENPYPPSPLVLESLRKLEDDGLRRYPDPAASDLVCAIADRCGVKPEQVFVGVGSDDVLAMSFLTFFNGGKEILFPDITYSFYDVWAGLFGIPYHTVPLDDRFRIVPADYRRENGGIIFPNPNAPTGELLGLEAVEEIVSANPDSVVIVDEAYIDFGGESCLPLLKTYDNLLVVQTFSKSRSLAGLRVGFAVGNETMIRYLQDVKYSFNSYTMNRPSIAAGTASRQDEAWFSETRGRIIRTRERVKGQLRELGFEVGDSMANFLFARHERVEASRLFEALRKQNIFVRYFNKPRIDQYLRITIGTDEQMDTLLAFLKQYLEGVNA